jgi:uncharacterized membrane protein
VGGTPRHSLEDFIMHRIGDLNLWALGYDDPTRAKEVRAEILRFENIHGLHVIDAIAVTRLQDGSFTLQRDDAPTTTTGILGFGFLGLLIGLVVLEPLAGAAIAATLGGFSVVSAGRIGIDDGFLNEVKELIKPGTSALFLLTKTDNPEGVLYHIRGLGGTVLKTNVHADLAQQVQEALHATRAAS